MTSCCRGLPTFNSEYAKLARQCAAEGKDHPQYLLRLCELELIERERRMIERRIKAAKFPATKSLRSRDIAPQCTAGQWISFDFKAIPSLNKALTIEVARCKFALRREKVIALGPSGTGKTHIALGLGLAACQKGLKVRFTTAAAFANVSRTIGVPLAHSTNSSKRSTIAGSSAYRRPSPARNS